MMSHGDSQCAALLRELMGRRPNDALLAFQLNRLKGVTSGVQIRMTEK
jgi:hypothetical protein